MSCRASDIKHVSHYSADEWLGRETDLKGLECALGSAPVRVDGRDQIKLHGANKIN